MPIANCFGQEIPVKDINKDRKEHGPELLKEKPKLEPVEEDTASLVEISVDDPAERL